MKIITAMVQPFMLNKVICALEEMKDFPGMTISEVRGFGRRTGAREKEPCQSGEYNEKARIEIVAPDEMVEAIVSSIIEHAHTGNHGDGKIFIWQVERAVRIQTGETGEVAI